MRDICALLDKKENIKKRSPECLGNIPANAPSVDGLEMVRRNIRKRYAKVPFSQCESGTFTT